MNGVTIGIEVDSKSDTAKSFGELFASSIDALGGRAVESPLDRPDLLVAVGAGATTDIAVSKALKWDVPILYMNTSDRAYAPIAESRVYDLAMKVLFGSYHVERRRTIAVTGEEIKAFAVREAVIENAVNGSLISLSVAIDGQDFCVFRADAVVLATPLGSVGYASSAGGSWVSTDVDALLLVPVACHSRFSRSLLLPPDSEVRISIQEGGPAKLVTDGSERSEISTGDVTTITANKDVLSFVELGSRSFTARVLQRIGSD